MKASLKIFYMMVILSMLIISASITTSAFSQEPKNTEFEAAMVFDIGGRGDKSFNDLAYEGLMKAVKDFGIKQSVATPTEGTDREVFLRKFAAGKAEIIIGVGFLFSDDITRLANDFPNKKFACIDYTIDKDKKMPANLTGLKFKEEEASCLVGIIAGMMTKTNQVGFIGGAKGPLIKKFEVGYTYGVNLVNPKCKVSATYAGVTGEAFANPVKGKELAQSLYNSNADIIYTAAGSTNLGVFKAAEELNKVVIGVDADQSGEARPGVIITSALKRVDTAVYEIIKDCIMKKYKGGIKEFGLKEAGVDYVYNDSNKKIIPEDVIKKVEEIKKQIIDGKITVPSK